MARLPRLLLAAAAAAALAGAAGPARAQEEPAKERAVPDRPRGEFVLQYGFATDAVDDGTRTLCFVENVFLARGEFSVEARRLVLWGNAEKLRLEAGSLFEVLGGGPRPEGEPAPGEEPAAPPPGEGFARKAPDDVRAFLGPVVFSLYAEEGVKFRLGKQVVRCERLFVDFHRNILATGKVLLTTTLAIPDRGRTVPLIVRAERMRQTSVSTLVLEDASYTTCEFEDPHFRFRCSEFVLSDYETYSTFTAYGNVVEVEGLPVFYLPVMGGRSDFSSRPFRSANVGRSDRFGYEAKVLWGDDIRYRGGKWGEWRLRTDWRSRRGEGIGPEVEYLQPGYEGQLLGYYQRDKAGLDEFNDTPVPRRDRGRVRWEHRHRLGENLRLDLSLYDFSDRNFQPEYLKEEALTGRDPESYAYLRYAERTDLASLTAKVRLDDFRTETEALPEAAFHRIGAETPGEGIWGGLLDDLTWTADATSGAYERKFDERLGIRGDRVFRQDAVARLEGVRRVGPVSLLPFVTAGATRYDGLERPGEGGSENRGDLAAGARAVVEARRDFPEVESDLFDLRGLRHLVTLDAFYENRWTVTESPLGVRAVDGLDRLAALEVAGLRLRQRWQTERAARRVDWIDLELRGLWFPEGLDPAASPLRFKEEGLEGTRFQDFSGEEKYRASPPRGVWGPYEADLRMRLRENLFLLGEGEYDAYDGKLRTAAVGARWFAEDRVSVYLGDRRIAHDSDIYTLRVDWNVSDRWAFGFTQQADLRRNRGLETSFAVRRVMHDFVLEFTFKNERTTDDVAVGVSLIPAVLWTPPTSAEKLTKLDYEAQRWYR